jgi:gliding motility-associated-like protein
MKAIYIICYLCVVSPCILLAQEGCSPDYVRVFGSLIRDEMGFSLAASLDQKSVFVGGIRGDSAVLLKVNTTGEIEWTRTFDVVPGRQDFIYRVLVDQDGMIGVSGIAGTQLSGGTVFVFRYDPENNMILWARELISNSTNFNLGMIEKGPGGNYLVTNNPTSPNNAELVELDKNTGQVVTSFSRHYGLGSSESIYDMEYYNNKIYCACRFTDGGSLAEMRNTLLRLDPADGSADWMKLGHKPASQTARLYGLDLVIADDDIFSIYVGDEDGTSINITSGVFIQRTSLNGDLQWIRQYELPGSNDWADEMISSQGGLIILARNRVAPSDLLLFKIDYNGDVLWAKQYDYSNNDNAVSLGSIQSQLIEADGHYYFTAFAEEGSDSDLILVRTDLEGNIGDTCAASTSIVIPVTDISNPVFYNQTPIIFDFVPQLNALSVTPGTTTTLQSRTVCATEEPVVSTLDIVICQGQAYDGYTTEGFYTDTLTSYLGCDSIRSLHLQVADPLQSFQDSVICPGQSYEGYAQPGMYIDTFITSSGCDSVRTLLLSMSIPESFQQHEICSGGEYDGYTQPGVYTDTIFGMPGECDTLRHLTLSVAPPIQFSLTHRLCPGDDYFGHTTPGVYIDTFSTTGGCDSIRTVVLSVIVPEVYVEHDICSGGQFEGYTQPGIYVDTLAGMASDCDTIRHLTLTVSPPIVSSFSQQACDGMDYFGYTVSGTYTDTLSTAEGCDSIRTVVLEVILPVETLIEAEICDTDTHGYTHPGTYVDTLTSTSGCDSIRTFQIQGSIVYVPNVFSPNNDQINDVFEVTSYPEEEMELISFTIFDRWGNMVHHSTTGPVQWDGKGNNGTLFNPGVFTYVMILSCGNKQIHYDGSITLVR